MKDHKRSIAEGKEREKDVHMKRVRGHALNGAAFN